MDLTGITLSHNSLYVEYKCQYKEKNFFSLCMFVVFRYIYYGQIKFDIVGFVLKWSLNAAP